jgi:rhomboid protease GluP
MTRYPARQGFIEIPHAAVYLLLTINIIVYGLCLNQSGGAAIAAQVLYLDGAMYKLALQRHEYWRLVTYGFLHFNLVHLASNMFCLVLWGGHLERRVGPAYFLMIYAASMVFGGIAGNLIHATPYLTAGASGATSGILGALLCLWILGRVDFPAAFFVINIGLNVAIAMTHSQIDWSVHLGGFAAGLIACAVLDLVAKANSVLLRCKFPEFVKTNLLLLACVFAFALYAEPATWAGGLEGWVAVAAYVAVCLLIVKAVDIVLSLTKGLAITAALLSIANACGLVMAAILFIRQLGSICRSPPAGPMEAILTAACMNPAFAIATVAMGVLVLTACLYSRELYRGIGDVGFVGATFRAERKRHYGI